ncbi:MAG: hypothetical protein ABJC36_08125 [Gemmatimonadales bacterium]
MLSPSTVSDLAGFAAGQGHPDYPCLSRTHAPSSCVPCADFSPWLAERVRRCDVEGVAEYLYRIREPNPGIGESQEELRANYTHLAERMVNAPFERYLAGGDEGAFVDLRVALALLAVHEGFSGFIMTGEAADFMASVMAPHPLAICDVSGLVDDRNRFVREMAKEMSYWAAWPMLTAEHLPPLEPPDSPELHRLLDALRGLPLGARAHAIDAVRHLSAHPHVPKTLASLSRYETRKRGLDVAGSSRLIMGTGIVVPATDLDGWLGTWTRRDLLGFLAQSGVGARNSWGKERLAEVAKTECADLLRTRMEDAGVVELAPEHVEGARQLRAHIEAVRECWRVWLAFGTGVGDDGPTG